MISAAPSDQGAAVATLVLIPARGGSKGIPRKNLMPVAGRPLIGWTIGQALTLADAVVAVSTEDDEIAAVAAGLGAHVIQRPSDLARDTTPTEPVVEHAITELGRDGREFERVMLLQATSPVRLPGTLRRAMAEFAMSAADSMVGVVAQAPFFWRAGASVTSEYDFRDRPRRQELRPEQLFYRETGSLYLTKTDVYRREHNRLGGDIALFVMDEIEGIDVDTPAELALAEQTLLNLEPRTERA